MLASAAIASALDCSPASSCKRDVSRVGNVRRRPSNNIAVIECQIDGALSEYLTHR